jgi:hypothetical protein
MRGTQMARNAAIVLAFRDSPRDVTSCRASKKTRTQIAMAVTTKISLSATDEVVDVRLLALEPLEGSVAISDIHVLHVVVSINAFRAALFAGRIVHCSGILRLNVQQQQSILAGSYLHSFYK